MNFLITSLRLVLQLRTYLPLFVALDDVSEVTAPFTRQPRTAPGVDPPPLTRRRFAGYR
jgi:hypothetical protein